MGVFRSRPNPNRGIPVNRGVQPYYASCRFDELSKGFVLCLLKASFKK